MTITDIQRERLQDLRDHIWRHGPEHFDMSTFLMTRDSETGRLTDADPRTANIEDCGTIGCIAGQASLVLRNRGELSMIPGGTFEGIPSFEALGDMFGLGESVFHLFLIGWEKVPYKDETLRDHEDKLYRNGSRHCEWDATIDYLDWLIKGDG